MKYIFLVTAEQPKSSLKLNIQVHNPSASCWSGQSQLIKQAASLERVGLAVSGKKHQCKVYGTDE